MDDPVLRFVKDFQAGVEREGSFRHIFQHYYPALRQFFQRKGFSDDQSSDLTQETFYRVFTTLDIFRYESRFARWLWEVANHVYLNELRRRHAPMRKGVEVSLESADGGGGGAYREIPATDANPLELVIRSEQRQALKMALGTLPEQMRMCCILRYERGLKYAEIATLMRISIETVKAHLHQARKRLTAKLSGPPEEPGDEAGGSS